MSGTPSRTNHPDPVGRRVFLQAWATVVYRCEDCGRSFQPLIHTQSGVVRLGAGAFGLLLYVGFAITGLAGVLVVAAVAMTAWGLYRRRDVYRGRGRDNPSYGQIIAACVYCRSRMVEPHPAFTAPTGRSFTLKDPNVV